MLQTKKGQTDRFTDGRVYATLGGHKKHKTQNKQTNNKQTNKQTNKQNKQNKQTNCDD